MKDEKSKVIEEAMKMLNKKYGTNTVIQLENIEMKIEAIPTGSIALDKLFGCGGLPRGRIIELFGMEGSGKSTLAQFIAAEIQRKGGKVAWIDAEFAFESDHAKEIGMNIENLFISQPETGEEALDIIDKMTSTSAIDLIVLDSVAALIPEKELAGEIKDAEMAQTARMMSKAMKMLAGNISKTKTTVVFINQIRSKIGVFFGNKNTTPGGSALKFFASVRLEVKKGKSFLQDGKKIGNEMIINAIKNKVGFPFGTAKLDLYYKTGVDLVAEAFDLGAAAGIIIKEGNTFSYGQNKLGVGREACITHLKILSDDTVFKLRDAVQKCEIIPSKIYEEKEEPEGSEM